MCDNGFHCGANISYLRGLVLLSKGRGDDSRVVGLTHREPTLYYEVGIYYRFLGTRIKVKIRFLKSIATNKSASCCYATA